MRKGYIIGVNVWECGPEVFCITESDAMEMAMSLFEEAAFYEFNYFTNWWGDDTRTAIYDALNGVCIIKKEMVIY